MAEPSVGLSVDRILKAHAKLIVVVQFLGVVFGGLISEKQVNPGQCFLRIMPSSFVASATVFEIVPYFRTFL